jgi:hypothetical protein
MFEILFIKTGEKMKMVVVSDIHNDVENIIAYTDKIAGLGFDVLIAVGDFIDFNIPKGFTKEDMGNLIIEQLLVLNKPIVAIPGNFDNDLIPLFEKRGINLHGKGRVIKNVGFYGYGGAKTPFRTSLEPEEKELENGLNGAFKMLKKCDATVQITHNPPARTNLDVAYTGAHVGSEAVRKFIEKNQPTVAISAHIHEARGTDEIGKTKLINPGRFPEGYCGLITIKNKEVKVEVVNLT